MKWVLNIVGVLLALMGIVWFFQGINVIPGSFMTGSMMWAIIGGSCIVVGGGMLYFANRRRATPPPPGGQS
jgi:hypothetical protein